MNYERELGAIQAKFSSAIKKTETDRVGCLVLWVEKELSLEVLKFLKEDATTKFEFLADLTAYDDLGTKEESDGRFVIVYNLLSLETKKRVRVKVRVAEGADVRSAVTVWQAANWAEREVFDMFGVKFNGHPDLRRILMDVRWEGYPLRKDYPLKKYQLFNEPEEIPEQLLREE